MGNNGNRSEIQNKNVFKRGLIKTTFARGDFLTRLKQDRRIKLYSKRPDPVHQRHLPHHVRPEVKRQPMTPILVHRNLKHLTDFQFEIRDLFEKICIFSTAPT